MFEVARADGDNGNRFSETREMKQIVNLLFIERPYPTASIPQGGGRDEKVFDGRCDVLECEKASTSFSIPAGGLFRFDTGEKHDRSLCYEMLFESGVGKFTLEFLIFSNIEEPRLTVSSRRSPTNGLHEQLEVAFLKRFPCETPTRRPIQNGVQERIFHSNSFRCSVCFPTIATCYCNLGTNARSSCIEES